jgi:hypothetical protein
MPMYMVDIFMGKNIVSSVETKADSAAQAEVIARQSLNFKTKEVKPKKNVVPA